MNWACSCYERPWIWGQMRSFKPFNHLKHAAHQTNGKKLSFNLLGTVSAAAPLNLVLPLVFTVKNQLSVQNSTGFMYFQIKIIFLLSLSPFLFTSEVYVTELASFHDSDWIIISDANLWATCRFYWLRRFYKGVNHPNQSRDSQTADKRWITWYKQSQDSCF